MDFPSSDVHVKNATIPMISVLMPVRNEEEYIARALYSVIGQDYPSGRFEILVIDGCSEDRTRTIVQQIAERSDHDIRLLDNGSRIVPTAFNLGLEHAAGAIIVRVDGHCELPQTYLTTCVKYLEMTGADCVGGQLDTVGDDYVANAIAIAQSSVFGVGGAAFRTGRKAEGFVDTVAFGAYRRSVFERIGGYDERLVRHQDYEFNLRLRQSGGKIFYTPGLRVRYYSRSSLKRLATQYYQYGYWKARVTLENPQAIRLRHLAPIVFVMWLFIGAVLSVLIPGARTAYAVSVGVYLMATLAASLVCAIDHGWRYAPVMPAAFVLLHCNWGTGFWHGILVHRPGTLSNRRAGHLQRNRAIDGDDSVCDCVAGPSED